MVVLAGSSEGAGLKKRLINEMSLTRAHDAAAFKSFTRFADKSFRPHVETLKKRVRLRR
jgi:hypothetical protein